MQTSRRHENILQVTSGSKDLTGDLAAKVAWGLQMSLVISVSTMAAGEGEGHKANIL